MCTANCKFVGATIANFGGSATCKMISPSDPGFVTWTVPNDSSARSWNYLNANTFRRIEVECSGPNGTASGSISW